ncbi:uncharacterized protein LOC111262122 isoform X1 [Varroa jacobsoni]|uniref:uncharacterized protein LOC111262122 isoform X1 n=1 Tax=Varroa jacobsoni TaxID=62625 RepID=UPI000BF749CD|nr:uncharacterized protein LOC111262122 isoform X1 [Varroa jacobsoni]
MQASLSLSILHFKFQLRYRSRARRHTNCVDNFVKMVKSKNILAEKATSNITDSALKRSAFQRRKQYGAQLKKSGVVSKTVKENIGTASKKTNANDTKKTSTASNTIRRNSKAFSSKPSNLPKFKSSVSREEMEELGCLPVGILFSGSGMRNRKATLSFSPHTKAFERTPIRGTPIRGMSLTGQQKTERVAEVLATLQRLEEALKNETATCAEVLTDLKGLELGRRSTVSDIAEFWMLKTQLLSESGDRKEAILAAVQAIFTTKHKKAKAELAREINTMLAVEVATGDSDGEEGQELEEDTVADRESNSAESVKNLFPTEHSKDQEKVFVAPDKTNSIEDSHLMLKNSQPKRSETPAASPERLYTPPDVKTTPMVPARSGSAVKSLRFTPLIASAQRLSMDSTRLKRLRIGMDSAQKKDPEKATPQRRSRRIRSLQPQI